MCMENLENNDLLESEKLMIKVVDENNDEKEVEVIHFFTLDSNDKEYVIYTENEEDEKGNVLIYFSEVLREDDKSTLIKVEDKEVVKEITKVIKDLMQE